MGLLDVLNGMQNGPRGQRTPTPSGANSGMSPITMAILGLLAYKAVKHLTAGQPAPAGSGINTAAEKGGLGDLLQNGLGGLLAGGAAGSVLSGGLNDLVKQFHQNGAGDAANSWIANGPNQQISPDTLSKVLSPDQIKMITDATGMSPDDIVNTLSQQLPEIINHLTPQGRIPTEHEASRMI